MLITAYKLLYGIFLIIFIIKGEIMNTTALLIWGIVFSSIGLGFFMYGKKEKNVVALISGLALLIYPYFISNTYLLVFIGIGLIAMPYFLKDY